MTYMVVDKVVGIVVERSLVEMADNLGLISNVREEKKNFNWSLKIQIT